MNLFPPAPPTSDEDRCENRRTALRAARAMRQASRPVRDLADLRRQMEEHVLEYAEAPEQRRARQDPQWWRAQDALDAAVDLLDAAEALCRGMALPADPALCDTWAQQPSSQPAEAPRSEPCEPIACKQVLVVRRDLNMPRGKIAAQASHGAVNALVRTPGAWRTHTELGEVLHVPLSPVVARWLDGEYRKIGLAVHSESELEALAARAREAGVRCEEVWDNGLTMFDGRKTLTAIALGPDEDGRLDALTGGPKLL